MLLSVILQYSFIGYVIKLVSDAPSMHFSAPGHPGRPPAAVLLCGGSFVLQPSLLAGFSIPVSQLALAPSMVIAC